MINLETIEGEKKQERNGSSSELVLYKTIKELLDDPMQEGRFTVQELKREGLYLFN